MSGYRCTHPCTSKHPEKPVCPFARNQEEAENGKVPEYCFDEDPDELPCEWLEEIGQTLAPSQETGE